MKKRQKLSLKKQFFEVT